MFDLLRKNFQSAAKITDEDLDTIFAHVRVMNVKRKKNVLSEGNIPNYLMFVNAGLVRMYTTDEQMEERTFDFGAEGTWFGDIKSFRTKQPSDTSIEAIEDSQLLTIAHDDLQQFYHTIPGLERVGRINAEDKYIRLLDRLKKINHTNYSAEDRYLEFLKAYSDIAYRIPTTYIASYLGIASETLSRIKKNISLPNL